MGSKKTTETSNQNSTATTTLPAWLTQGSQDNYNAASAYFASPDAVWTPEKAAQYANPYQQQVQDRTVARMGVQNQVEHQNLNDTAEAAKAYGGTRHAVLEAAQGRDQNMNLMDYLASSNAQGYDAARAAFESDRAAKAGGYATLAQMLAAAPKNVTTTGTQNGTSTSQQQGSFLDTLLGVGQLGLSAFSTFSDRRLKTDIELLDRDARGLGTYRFRYLWERADQPSHTGVMADEVAEIAPEALGPIVGGYRTVNYDALGRVFA